MYNLLLDSPYDRPALVRYSGAACSVIAGLALRWSLDRVLGPGVPYITLFPAVMFASWFGGLWPGVLAIALSLLAAVFLIIPASHPSNPMTLVDITGAIVFAGVSIFISVLNESLGRSRVRTDERLRELAAETARRSGLEGQLVESRREVERAQGLFKTILTSIGDAVIATDLDGKVIYLNTVAEQLTGWNREEALARPISDVFVTRNERTGLGVDNPLNKRTVLITKDKRDISIEDTAAPVRDELKRVIGSVLVFRDVTERRKSERALARSEERLRAIYDGTYEYIGLLSPEGVLLEANRASLEFANNTRADVVGRLFWETPWFTSTPGASEAVRLAVEKAAAGEFVRFEATVIRPSGENPTFDISFHPVRNANGKVVLIVPEGRDITERKNAEEKLHEQWRAFDTALSNTPDFTYTFDLAGRFTYVNRALLSLWQKTLDEAIGKNFFDLEYPVDLAQRLHRQIQQVVDTKETVRDHTPFRGPTGETRHYEYIFVPVLASDGQVVAIAGSTRDFTERSRVESALRTSEERLTLALEAGGGVGTWDWDITTDRVFANLEFAKFYSVPLEHAVAGAPIAEFVESIHPDDRERVTSSIQRAMEAGGDYAEEYRLTKGNGQIRWVHARGRCHLDDKGAPARFPGVAFDITERKRAEEDLLRVNRELEEFAYVASHDLQEPLRMVNIYTQLILKDMGAEGEKLGEYADFVQEGVSRMQALIRDLLMFARTNYYDELQIGTTNLTQSLSEAVAVLKNRIDEAGAIVTSDVLPTVRADATQIAQVFQNLLSNTLKYRKGGVPPQVHITSEQKSNSWIISVRDNGIGFLPEYAERIFGLFKRLHRQEIPGTGLGLAICKRIVERYGGRIWAEGRLGEGATFYFELPRVNDAPL